MKTVNSAVSVVPTLHIGLYLDLQSLKYIHNTFK